VSSESVKSLSLSFSLYLSLTLERERDRQTDRQRDSERPCERPPSQSTLTLYTVSTLTQYTVSQPTNHRPRIIKDHIRVHIIPYKRPHQCPYKCPYKRPYKRPYAPHRCKTMSPSPGGWAGADLDAQQPRHRAPLVQDHVGVSTPPAHRSTPDLSF
jgi:hypothetical protein